MLLYPCSLDEAAKCSGGVADRLLFVAVAEWVDADLSRLDIQVRDQLVCRAEVVALTRRVLPNIVTNIGCGEAEVLADRRLIDLQKALWD